MERLQPILNVTDIRKVYGKKGESESHALRGVSFSMNKGEFIGIMGPSGSGKTTLLNVISTLDRPTEGSIRIADTDITSMRQGELADFRARQLGFIFQDFNLLETLTVYENIALPLFLQDKPAAETESCVRKVTELLGIEAVLAKYPTDISGGQKQRAAAARALVHGPALLLGDEPTGSLDSKNAAGLLEAMKRLNENNGVSIMMVTHDAYCASYCQRILFIQDGLLYREIRRAGTREAFFKQTLEVLAEMGAAAH